MATLIPINRPKELQWSIIKTKPTSDLNLQDFRSFQRRQMQRNEGCHFLASHNAFTKIPSGKPIRSLSYHSCSCNMNKVQLKMPAVISSFHRRNTRSCKIRLLDDPLKKARSAVELYVKMNTSVPFKSPSHSMQNTISAKFFNLR